LPLKKPTTSQVTSVATLTKSQSKDSSPDSYRNISDDKQQAQQEQFSKTFEVSKTHPIDGSAI
jgi:hypothetical protein